MKKFLSAAVAFGMVAGVAATASALELNVKGVYKLDGYWVDGFASNSVFQAAVPFTPMMETVDGVVTYVGEPTDGDWYQHTFRLNADLIVNDKVKMRTDIRLIDSNTVWPDNGGTDNGGYVDVNKVWLVWDSPVGRIEAGRRPGGAWQNDFVSSSTNADRLMWFFPSTGGFNGYAFTQKQAEIDKGTAFDSDGPLVSGFNGADKDYYEVAGGYSAEGMKAMLALGTSQQDNSLDFWRVKGYGQVGAGPVTILSEFDYKFGDKSNGAVDISSYAFLLAATGNAGNISYMAGYFTISGDNDSDMTEDNAYDPAHGTGDDFEPLYIMTGNRTNVLNGDAGGTNSIRQAGVHALVATADFKVSEDLSLHGGLGWGMADDEPGSYDDAYGWEADLGLSYKLYQNLTYDLHFGYWFVGDFAEMGGAADTEDVMLLSNHLSMKF